MNDQVKLPAQIPLLCALAVGCALTVGVVLPSSVAAQTPATAVEQIDEGRGFFMIGTQRLSIDGLNFALNDAGYPGLSASSITLGGGGMGVNGSFLIGGEGHAILGSDRTTADGALTTRMGGGYGLFTVGYELLPEDMLSLYPMVGIGAGGMSLKIHERAAPIFDDMLEDPRRGVEMSRASFLFMVAVGGDYMIEVPHEGPGRGGMALGLRVGYVISLGQGSWSSDVGSVAGGPDLSPAGPFIRLQVGGGQRR